MTEPLLARPVAAPVLRAAGWRYLYNVAATAVPVTSLTQALAVAGLATAAAGRHADAHLRIDVRHDRCELRVNTIDRPPLSSLDLDLVADISAALTVNGHQFEPLGGPRPVQTMEIAIDSMDIPAVRPFWKAVLGYRDDPADDDDPGAGIIDPTGQHASVWFQQMDAPRPQRNRIHLDLTVPEDDAERRVAAALAAGGTLLSDRRAKAFWALADAEGNEICICTWQDRD